uniref:Uncharacterized protein n=1 Tax=Rhizophagus irregularis (strain DAOM 181602 / DAOM 197198 / MUCL 43194) TaxID=747089 RepID=U9UBF7_RHIID
MFPPSKKHIHPEDSNTLQKLICELSSDITRISEIKERKALDKESALKEKHLDHYKKTEEEHEAQKRVNDEVRGQLPKEVTNDDKIGRVVNIRQIKTFSASSIAKLSWDDILYVATQVKKNNRRDPAPLGAPQESMIHNKIIKFARSGHWFNRYVLLTVNILWHACSSPALEIGQSPLNLLESNIYVTLQFYNVECRQLYYACFINTGKK